MTTRFTTRGNLDLLCTNYHKVGVIGSRDVYSTDLIQAVAQGLKVAEDGNVLVTGMAAGIDTFAMVGALCRVSDKFPDKNQKHIAVIPSLNGEGIPSNNKVLLDEIEAKNGLIVAIENPDIDYKSMYLRRNDILLNIVNELVTVGPLGKGAGYTENKAREKGIPVKKV